MMTFKSALQMNKQLQNIINANTEALDRSRQLMARMEADFRRKDALILLAELVKIIGRTLAKRVQPRDDINALYVEFGPTNKVVYFESSKPKKIEVKDNGIIQMFTQRLKSECQMTTQAWTTYSCKMTDVRNKFCHRVPRKYSKPIEFRKLMLDASKTSSSYRGLFKQATSLLRIAKTLTGKNKIVDVFADDMWEENDT